MQRGEFAQQYEVEAAQGFPPPDRPVFVAVFGQEFAAVEAEGGGVVGQGPSAPGRGDGGLEHGRVDPEPPLGLQGEGAILAADRAVGSEDPAGGVERAAQIIVGGGRVEFGPEGFHHLLALQALRGREGEEFDEAAGLAPPPTAIDDRRAADHQAKTTE